MKSKIILGTRLILCSLACFVGCDKPAPTKSKANSAPANNSVPEAAATNFATERASFRTTLRVHGPAPQAYNRASPPTGVSEVLFPSGALKLKAWISDVPKDGSIHPAIVYCHGGFSFGADDWEQSKPYRDAGLIVMMPMLRAENGNPGEFEMFQGEVDDAIAAGDFLAKLTGVDKTHLFIAGHSAGGTITSLASLLPSPFVAAAAFGGNLDVGKFLADPEWRAIAPFDPSNANEIRFRSSKPALAAIRCPLFLACGSQEAYFLPEMRALQSQPPKTRKEFMTAIVPGDHFSSVKEGINRSIAFFAKVAPAR